MPIFKPEPHHEHIGTFFSKSNPSDDIDHDLYYDTQRGTFFVVESFDVMSGPRQHVYFNEKIISEQKAREIVAFRADKPELAEKAAPYFRAC